MDRRSDGSAGDANYGSIGGGYTHYRQPDPRIAAWLHAALGSAERILNIGAGAGSYEPTDRLVTPVEPSATMRAQRPEGLAAAIDATAERLPFEDDAFDAAMASFTVHQWNDLAKGLSEVRRVTKGPVVILTCLPDLVRRFWLNDYAPEVLATEARRYPSVARIAAGLGGDVGVMSVPIPFDCRDGFNEAYFGRPEMLLEPGARRANSAWSFVAPDIADEYVRSLSEALDLGQWDARYGHLRHQAEFDGSLRLIVGNG